MEDKKQYYDIERRTEVREEARKLRRLYLRYKEAELVYSITHKKLLELAGNAGAIYRIDGTVLINREIFEEYLEQFREESTLTDQKETTDPEQVISQKGINVQDETIDHEEAAIQEETV